MPEKDYTFQGKTIAEPDEVNANFDELYTELNALLARLINTTAPLTGGGDLSDDRTIAIPKATASVDGYLAKEDFADFTKKFKIGSFTIDVSTTGEQAITGAGFKPKVAIFLSIISGTKQASWGVDNKDVQNVTYQRSDDSNFYASGSFSIYLASASGTFASAKITTLGDDGFTITKSKTGSPTGTATVGYFLIG